MPAVHLGGIGVLVLEDDYYLAADLANALGRAGATVHGPCGSEEDALALLDADRPDCALLDINLGDGPTFEVADRLTALRIPFAFVTGYDDGTAPARFAHVPQVRKPLTSGVAPAVISQLME